jgi:hypothetical protein
MGLIARARVAWAASDGAGKLDNASRRIEHPEHKQTHQLASLVKKSNRISNVPSILRVRDFAIRGHLQGVAHHTWARGTGARGDVEEGHWPAGAGARSIFQLDFACARRDGRGTRSS